MNFVWRKCIPFLRLLRNWCKGAVRDGPFLGYLDAFRWHSIPLRNQLRHYSSRPLIIAPREVRIHGCEHPVWLRPGTSDYYVYRQVFVEQEYGGVIGVDDPKFILDCGANIGLASIYFLNRFPETRILAIEPDSENIEICLKNLEPYSSRAVVIQGGVWSERSALKVIPSEHGGGNKWGIQVRSLKHPSNGEVVEGYDIPTLLCHADAKHVDILKMDIEGSELPVFSSFSERWLPQVKNLVIELHGDNCAKSVFSALEHYDYKLLSRGDLTYFLGLKPKGQDKPTAGLQEDEAIRDMTLRP